ncbi:ephrin-B2b [Tachysurus fulvidraco]|uniref:ephrin-B2b n=1 Tax=Tachysurus fulvidraco TaxID=1234273 RepID=UPI000F4ECD53|nr:ephrin-B2b [Tachysurus fulvidraco]
MDLMWKTLLALLLIVCRLKLSVSTILESIYWNTSNTKFVPGKGITLYPQIGDKMDIVCPRLRPGQSASTRIEYFRVYLVTQEQLESCRVEKDNVALLNCDKPDQDVKFTFKFQEFSPNLWGLEFFKGKDYHVISTSNSTLEGLDNMDGGVCKTNSMKLVLRVGQSPSDAVSEKEHPKHSDSDHQSTSSKDNDVLSKVEQDRNGGESVGVSGSEVALFTGVASGAFVLVVLVIVVLVVFTRRRRRRKQAAQCSAPLALHPIPKRNNNNNGSERSDIIFPLRASDSYYCPHYEKVSGDYGHPVYIVQEMEPQNPANVYYKV